MKQISFDKDLEDKLENGLKKAIKLISSTYGPLGNTVLIKDKEKLITTKDGVTVAKYLEFDDKEENLAAQIIKQAAESTNKTSGDGTSITSILTEAIYRFAKRETKLGTSLPEVIKSLEESKEELLKQLKEKSKAISGYQDLKEIALVSSNNDEMIANLLVEAIQDIGQDGSITIQDSNTRETELEILDGFRIDKGIAASILFTDKAQEIAKLKNCNIFVTDYDLTTVEHVAPITAVGLRDSKPLVIFCNDIHAEALSYIIINNQRGNMKCIAIAGPKFGDERISILNDLAISCGATVYSLEQHADFENVNINHFGHADMVESGKNFTTIVGGKGDENEILSRIELIEKQLKEEKSELISQSLIERKARLTSGVAVIRVGGNTEAQQQEIKDRFQDALEAIKAAIEEGIIPGGSSSFMHLNYDQNKVGMRILEKALREPFNILLKNADLIPEIYIEEIKAKDFNYGFNVRTKEVVDFYKEGIIDPYKTARCALTNAISAATVLLSSKSSIICLD